MNGSFDAGVYTAGGIRQKQGDQIGDSTIIQGREAAGGGWGQSVTTRKSITKWLDLGLF